MNTPQLIKFHKKSNVLELGYTNEVFQLSAEYLRVYSPSAEVKGHGLGQEVLQHGKLKVGIDKIEPMGNYAVRIVFNDGHDSGLYTWEYLYDLGINQESHWADYLQRLHASGQSRDAAESTVKFIQP